MFVNRRGRGWDNYRSTCTTFIHSVVSESEFCGQKKQVLAKINSTLIHKFVLWRRPSSFQQWMEMMGALGKSNFHLFQLKPGMLNTDPAATSSWTLALQNNLVPIENITHTCTFTFTGYNKTSIIAMLVFCFFSHQQLFPLHILTAVFYLIRNRKHK